MTALKTVTIMQEHPHLPVAEPAAGAESEARSEMPRASIIVSLLVALSTSLVAVWIRALDVLRSSFIMVPLLGDVLRRVGFSCLGGNRGLADCWERERRGEERNGRRRRSCECGGRRG
jgi:hypothetical protein